VLQFLLAISEASFFGCSRVHATVSVEPLRRSTHFDNHLVTIFKKRTNAAAERQPHQSVAQPEEPESQRSAAGEPALKRVRRVRTKKKRGGASAVLLKNVEERRCSVTLPSGSRATAEASRAAGGSGARSGDGRDSRDRARERAPERAPIQASHCNYRAPSPLP